MSSSQQNMETEHKESGALSFLKNCASWTLQIFSMDMLLSALPVPGFLKPRAPFDIIADARDGVEMAGIKAADDGLGKLWDGIKDKWRGKPAAQPASDVPYLTPDEQEFRFVPSSAPARQKTIEPPLP